MTTTLVIPSKIAAELRALVQLDVETGGVLLARLVQSECGDWRLLASRLRLVGDNAYVRRDSHRLEIRSDGYVPALREADDLKMIPIWIHTHPGEGSSSKSSEHDRRVDEQLSEVFRLRSGSRFYGAATFSPAASGLRFTGMIDDGQQTYTIDRLMMVGPRLSLHWSEFTKDRPLPVLFDRNIKAFGGDIQRVLGDLRIAVVGCGGTGSAVAEQLVRLGVRHFTLVDPDRLTESNITRVYGSGVADVGRLKVDILKDEILRVAPDAEVNLVAGMITVKATARSLIGYDVLFGCTDDNAGRLVLSRLATYMLIPVFDTGVLITSDERGRLIDIHGRVTILHPGAACLVCRNRIDLSRAASEMLSPEERTRRVDEGYAPALAGAEPAVVTFTTLVAATAVSELLERLIGYGSEPPPTEILLRVHEREISTNVQEPKERHYCHPASGKLGLGDTDPFLEQTWPI